eukprot:7238710-Pyramimonas_sp.AAC.1
MKGAQGRLGHTSTLCATCPPPCAQQFLVIVQLLMWACSADGQSSASVASVPALVVTRSC